MRPDTAAFFDVDRTLLPGNTMERLFLRHLIYGGHMSLASLISHLTYGFRNMRRGEQSEAWHQNKRYLRHLEPELLECLAAECFTKRILPLISPVGREKLVEHQVKGHLVVLLTGSLEPLALQLGENLKADLVLSAKLEQKEGCYTGSLSNQRPYGSEKARLLKETARDMSLDLESSYAYGDHHSDVKALEIVGNPRAVNPDKQLHEQASQRGWPVLWFN